MGNSIFCGIFVCGKNTVRKNKKYTNKRKRKMIAVISAIEDDDQRRKVEYWYKLHYGLMSEKAYEIVRDYHLANDMVNEAFIKIINNYEKIATLNYNKRMSYLIGTVRSVSYDFIRKQNKEPLLHEDFEDTLEYNIIEEKNSDTPEQIFVDNKNVEQVAKAIEKLDERDTMLIIEKFYFDKTDTEIGELVGMNPRHVHVYANRACKKLLDIINGDETDGE